MNAAPDDRDLIDVYVAALAADDTGAALAALSPDAVFQSPFRAWRGRHLPSVFHARRGAFDNVLVSSVVRGHDQAVILWNATVGDTAVEAAELVSVSDGAIRRVDVYLRPAAALDVVHQAMAAAWPPNSASPDRARNPTPEP
jgi:hypothetical protein